MKTKLGLWQVELIFFKCENPSDSLKEFINLCSGQSKYSLNHISNVSEVNQFVQMQGNAIIIFNVNEKTSLAETLTLVKGLKKNIKANHVKIAGFNSFGVPNVDIALKKEGVTEVLSPGVKPKTLLYKLEMWAKTLVIAPQNVSAQEEEKKVEKEATKSGSQSDQKNQATQERKVSTVKPLDLKSDCWILKKEGDAKNVMGKWMVLLLGPGPSTGKWIEQQQNGKVKTWKWEFKNKENNPFIRESGYWQYDGSNMPEFDYKMNRWLFVGIEIKLEFHGDSQVFARFKTLDRTLEISSNSAFALGKEPEILKSLEEEVSFKKEKKTRADESEDQADDKITDDYQPLEQNFAKEKTQDSKPDRAKAGSEVLNDKMRGKGQAEDKLEDLKGENAYQENSLDKNLRGQSTLAQKPLEDLHGENSFKENPLDKNQRGRSSSSTNRLGNLQGENSYQEGQIDKNHNNQSGKTDHLEDLKGGNKFKEKALDKNQASQEKGQVDKFKDLGADNHFKEKSKNNNNRGKGGGADHLDDLQGENSYREGDIAKNRPGAKSPGQSFADKQREWARNHGGGPAKDPKHHGQPSEEIDPYLRGPDGSYQKKKKEMPRYYRDENDGKFIESDEGGQISTESGTLKLQVVKLKEGKVDTAYKLAVISFSDLFEDELTVHTKDSQFQVQDQVFCKLDFTYNNQAIKINAKGVVQDCEWDEATSEYTIIVKLENLNRNDLNKFLDLYSQRQQAIQDFIKQVKGVA